MTEAVTAPDEAGTAATEAVTAPVVVKEHSHGGGAEATVIASRATSIAYPGTVVVSPELRELLEGDPAYEFRVMRPRMLKNIGRVQLAVMRRAGDAPSTIREAIDERRRVMREALLDRLSLRPEGS